MSQLDDAGQSRKPRSAVAVLRPLERVREALRRERSRAREDRHTDGAAPDLRKPGGGFRAG